MALSSKKQGNSVLSREMGWQNSPTSPIGLSPRALSILFQTQRAAARPYGRLSGGRAT